MERRPLARRLTTGRLSAALVLTVGITACFGSLPLRAQQQEIPPEVLAYADMTLFNGKVLTADDEFTVAEAVAVRDGKIMAVGTSERINRLAGPQTRRIDLKGQTLIPGIVDLHVHPLTGGMMNYWRDKWMAGVGEWKSGADVLRDLRKIAQKAKPGELIVIPRPTITVDTVGGLDAAKGGRSGNICDAFTLAELDEASPDNPVIFVSIVNITPYAINSQVAREIKHLVRPIDAPIFQEERFPGRPCVLPGGTHGGVMAPGAQATKDYMFWAMPLEEQVEVAKRALATMGRHGVTLAKEHTVPPLLTGLRELWVRGEMTVRWRGPLPIYPHAGMDIHIPKDEAELFFRRMGNLSGVGDDMWRFTGLRPPSVGGNVKSGDAWTKRPKIRDYPDRSGEIAPYGSRLEERMDEDVFRGREAVVQAVRFGWDVSGDHTVGDRAVHELLLAFEEGKKNQLVKTPNQQLTLNHTPMVDRADIDKMAELGVNVSTGIEHVWGGPEMGGGYIEAALHQYGPDRVSSMLPLKSYVKAGMKPVLEAVSWQNVERVITREVQGRVWGPQERMSRQEALWMITNWPSTHINEQDRIGTVEVGKYADLVILDKDFMTIPENQIHQIKPVMTILQGKVVYEAAGASAFQ